MSRVQIVELVPVQPCYDEAIKSVIQSVGREFGAVGEGFGPSDPEVLAMSQYYAQTEQSLYLIALLDGEVVGGGGIAQFGEHSDVCELRKLFILPKARGLGLGKQLIQSCLDFAQRSGYASCYLDTLASMEAAIILYRKFGFEHLEQPYPGTIHNGCDVWMLKSLTD